MNQTASPSTANRAEEVGVGLARPRRAAVSGRCVAVAASGRPCSLAPLAGRERCRFHEAQVDPALGEQVALARRRGGLHATVRHLPESFPAPDYSSRDGVRRLLEATTSAVVKGELAPAQANSVAQLCNTALRRLAELEAEAREATRLEHRLREHEKPRVNIVPAPWLKRLSPTSENSSPEPSTARTDDTDDVEASRCENCGIALVETKGTEVICGGCKALQRPPMETA
jgi:hypothetical protein